MDARAPIPTARHDYSDPPRLESERKPARLNLDAYYASAVVIPLPRVRKAWWRRMVARLAIWRW
jgi:hypothetical protein